MNIKTLPNSYKLSNIDVGNHRTKVNYPKKSNRKTYLKLTESQRSEVANYAIQIIKNDEYKNLDEIASKYDISVETCRRILIAYGVDTPNQKTPKKEEEETVVEVKEETPVEATVEVPTVPVEKFAGAEKVEVSRIVKCITCSERHPVSLNNAIFGTGVTPEEMFDFENLQKKAEDFIKSNINFAADGKALDSMELTTTGLTMLTTAVITACNNLQVNLTIMHYDRESRTYKPQVVFDKFAKSIESSPIINYLKGLKEFGAIYQYGCNLRELSGEFYMVTIKYYNSLYQATPNKVKYIFCKDYEDSFILYGNSCKEVKKHVGRIQVNLMNAKISSGIFSYDSKSGVNHIYTNFS